MSEKGEESKPNEPVSDAPKAVEGQSRTKLAPFGFRRTRSVKKTEEKEAKKKDAPKENEADTSTKKGSFALIRTLSVRKPASKETETEGVLTENEGDAAIKKGPFVLIRTLSVRKTEPEPKELVAPEVSKENDKEIPVKRGPFALVRTLSTRKSKREPKEVAPSTSTHETKENHHEESDNTPEEPFALHRTLSARTKAKLLGGFAFRRKAVGGKQKESDHQQANESKHGSKNTHIGGFAFRRTTSEQTTSRSLLAKPFQVTRARSDLLKKPFKVVRGISKREASFVHPKMEEPDKDEEDLLESRLGPDPLILLFNAEPEEIIPESVVFSTKPIRPKSKKVIVEKEAPKARTRKLSGLLGGVLCGCDGMLPCTLD